MTRNKTRAVVVSVGMALVGCVDFKGGGDGVDTAAPTGSSTGGGDGHPRDTGSPEEGSQGGGAGSGSSEGTAGGGSSGEGSGSDAGGGTGSDTSPISLDVSTCAARSDSASGSSGYFEHTLSCPSGTFVLNGGCGYVPASDSGFRGVLSKPASSDPVGSWTCGMTAGALTVYVTCCDVP
jgi:hypothetical protein